MDEQRDDEGHDPLPAPEPVEPTPEMLDRAPADASPFDVPLGRQLLEGDYDADASPFRLPDGDDFPQG